MIWESEVHPPSLNLLIKFVAVILPKISVKPLALAMGSVSIRL